MKQVVLLGTAPSSMMLAPFGNPDWEIWGCSPGTMSAPRIDRRYEVHRWEPGKEWFTDTYVQHLKDFKGPVRMFQPVPDVPNCEVIDVEALIKQYSPYFFTSSLAWMMAEAINEGATKIAFYGVDMAATSEYHDQRMGCQYFAMLAASMGIEVGVPPESDLLRPAPLYGACENSHFWIKETDRARELAGRQRDAQNQLNALTAEVQFLKGAMDDQDWHLHSVVGAYDTMGNTGTQAFIPDCMRTTLVTTGEDK